MIYRSYQKKKKISWQGIKECKTNQRNHKLFKVKLRGTVLSPTNINVVLKYRCTIPWTQIPLHKLCLFKILQLPKLTYKQLSQQEDHIHPWNLNPLFITVSVGTTGYIYVLLYIYLYMYQTIRTARLQLTDRIHPRVLGMEGGVR